VPFTATSPHTLQATVTTEANLAPPGPYLLSITDNAGVPSVALWVRVGP
jgi:hypothetical protein